MNLRWLVGNFTDPQYKLSRRDQFKLSSKAHESYVGRGDFAKWTGLVILPPFLVGILLKRPALVWLGYANDSTVSAVAFGVMVLLFWLWSAWMYRYLYLKPIRKAMREAGYDLCIECGYNLKGLLPTTERCPECGTERVPIPKQLTSKDK